MRNTVQSANALARQCRDQSRFGFCVMSGCVET